MIKEMEVSISRKGRERLDNEVLRFCVCDRFVVKSEHFI